MTGFVKKRGSTWTAYWETKDPATGRRQQPSKGGFRTKREAQAYLNSALSRVLEGTWNPDKPMTVAQLLNDNWLPAQKSRGLKPTTLDQYGHVINDWIVPNIAAVQVRSLTPAEVQKLVEKLRTTTTAKGKAGLSDRSLQMTVGTLKTACNWALQTGILGRNPIAGMPRPRVQHRAMTAWSVANARQFLDLTKDDRLAAAWALLLTRGPRRGEVCGLRWEAVDLDTKTMSIALTRVVVDGKAVTSTPKTASGRRSVPLDDLLVKRLKALRARQAAEKLAAGDAYADGDYVFTNELGRPYHPDWVSDRFDQLVRASGLPRIRLHDTRHTAASLMLADGVPTKVVSELLGHASPTITLALYAHVLPGMAEEAGAALSASLLG